MEWEPDVVAEPVVVAQALKIPSLMPDGSERDVQDLDAEFDALTKRFEDLKRKK